MEKANTLCCNYWSSKGYSYLNKSCLTRLQGPIQSHCNSPDEQSSSYLSITKTNNVTRREWTSSSAQICSPLSKCVTDRQSPKRRESPAIKSTDWPQAISLQRLEKKVVRLFCHFHFPPGFSVTFWIISIFGRSLKLEAPFAVEVNHFSTSPIATMPGALSVFVQDWWGLITPFKSVWTVGQKHPQQLLFDY